jgi:hypothetical protein
MDLGQSPAAASENDSMNQKFALLLDFIPEKCEHFSLQFSETHA